VKDHPAKVSQCRTRPARAQRWAEDVREDDVAEIFVALEVPTELGRAVFSSPVVRSSVDNCPDARIVSRAASQDSEGAYRDFGAASLLLLGTPSAVAAVTGLFAVIRTMIKEAHRTIRDGQSQQYDLQKLVLVLGARREEIDLARDLKEIEARLDELQREATEKTSA
jgi:hypothetical protein